MCVFKHLVGVIMDKQKGFTSVELMVVVIWLAGVVGWCLNIYKIIGSDFGMLTGMLVARIIGVFVAPLGAILGFF